MIQMVSVNPPKTNCKLTRATRVTKLPLHVYKKYLPPLQLNSHYSQPKMLAVNLTNVPISPSRIQDERELVNLQENRCIKGVLKSTPRPSLFPCKPSFLLRCANGCFLMQYAL